MHRLIGSSGMRWRTMMTPSGPALDVDRAFQEIDVLERNLLERKRSALIHLDPGCSSLPRCGFVVWAGFSASGPSASRLRLASAHAGADIRAEAWKPTGDPHDRLDRINAFAGELTAIRRDIHAHPEIGFEEVRTSGLVARELEKYGSRSTPGIGKTGVVGIVHGKRPGNRRVGLRADMDALPMDETADVPWKSKVAGKFHGCGHDGHMTMLLGARATSPRRAISLAP